MEKQAWIDYLKSLEKNAITATASRQLKPPTQIHTKVGGIPDRPPDFEWPYFENLRKWPYSSRHPLSFIAQIRLDELIPYDIEHLLPNHGILYFFFDLEAYEDVESWVKNVFYYDGDLALLKPHPLPEEIPDEGRFPEFTLNYQTLRDHPSCQVYCKYYDREQKYEKWDESYEVDAEEAGYAARSICDDRVFKLLGYGDIIQNEVLSCAVYQYQSLCSESQEESQPLDWINLFQTGFLISSDCQEYWGDGGSLYFYIRKQDLKNKNFHHVCVMHECG